MIDRSGQAETDRSVSALLRATRRIGLPVSAELQPSNLKCSRSPFDANQPRNQESLCAHGDLFAENVPDEWIDRVFAVMALAPQHTFQVLTKRAERMRDYCRRLDERGRHPSMTDAALMAATGRWSTPALDLRMWPLPNVWLGISAEDQKRADERVPLLLDTPAAVRWVSAEPLLGPIDFRSIEGFDALCSASGEFACLDWIVVGGESGAGARLMHPDWARAIRDQCAAAGVAFLFKQWGAWAPVVAEPGEDGELDAVVALAGCSDPNVHQGHHECRFWQGDEMVHWPLLETLPAIGARLVGKKAAGRHLDGVTHDAFPQVSP